MAIRAIADTWKTEMTPNKTLVIAIMVVSSYLASGAYAADQQDEVVATVAAPAVDSDGLHAKLAESANTAAAEDAVEALLAANKLDLDVRFIGRASVQIADGR